MLLKSMYFFISIFDVGFSCLYFICILSSFFLFAFCLFFYVGLILNDEEKVNYTLLEIEMLLNSLGKSLVDFPSMPLPDANTFVLHGNKLLNEELSYDCDVLKVEHDDLVTKLTDEQRHVYDITLGDVADAGGGLYFVYGYEGTGKTFVWKTLTLALRSKGHIVLNVSFIGIASLLMPGGRTTHSRFAIPININEDSTCNIAQGNDLAELIIKVKLIIWDEAPMMHKHYFEALDRSMRDLLRFVNPLSLEMTFGGKTVVLGGDFRQILPVIPKGTRQDIVGASINSSYLWHSCKVLKLTKNMRLQRLGLNESSAKIDAFSKWIANVGDGLIGSRNDGSAVITIPEENVCTLMEIQLLHWLIVSSPILAQVILICNV